MNLLNSVPIACYLHILVSKGGEREDGTSIPLEEPSTLQVDGWDGCNRPLNRIYIYIYIYYVKGWGKKKDLSLEIDYCNKHMNMNIISTWRLSLEIDYCDHPCV